MNVYGVDIDFKNSSGYFFNADCMEGMKQFPDKYFELAIVDPPYGDGGWGGNPDRFGARFEKYKHDSVTRTGGTLANKYSKNIIAWDVAPPKEYFDELFRVSKNQIIWGGELLRSTADTMLFSMA